MSSLLDKITVFSFKNEASDNSGLQRHQKLMDPYYKHLVTSKHEWNFRYNLYSAKKVSRNRESK